MNITLVHAAALGDTVLLLPLLRTLAAAFPGARRTVVTRPDFGRLLVALGAAEAWHSADDPRHTSWFAPPPPPAAAVPWAPADLLISAVSDGRDAWAHHARRTQALTKSGQAGSTIPPLVFFHPRPPADFPGHVTRWHTAQLAAQGLPLPAAESTAPAGGAVRRSWDASVRRPRDASERRILEGPILLHPGAGAVAKCWPLASFLALAKALSDKHLRVEFVLGEAEVARWPAAAVAEIQRTFLTHVDISLYDLSQLLARAALYLGNDAGPTHLAAALGTPTLALFGPSNPTHWAPLGPAVRVLSGGPTWAELPPEKVLAEITRFREELVKNSGT